MEDNMINTIDWENLKNPNIFINGDCLEYMKTMPDNYADLALVDPPYGLGDKTLTSGGTWSVKWQKKGAEWDTKPTDEYFQELFRVSKNQIIWGGNYFNLPPSRCFIIWDKVSHMPSMADCEYAWCSFDKNAKIYKHIRNTEEKRIHICQKPIKLYKWILSNYATKGDKILDTHVGSGSSLIACYDMGFEYMGFEIDKEYYEAASKRIEDTMNQVSFFNTGIL
jgi:site-specific DNA-methyltransferase (adenine-specific)